MNRGNMGKQISNAPKSKSTKVKKMFGGGMASMPPPMFGGGDKSMPGKPGFGRMPTPPPSPGGAFTSMPSKPSIGGPGVRRPMPMPMPGKPSIDGPVLRGGPAPMPGGVRGVSGPKPALMGMAKGGKIDGCCMKGHTKGTMK